MYASISTTSRPRWMESAWCRSSWPPPRSNFAQFANPYLRDSFYPTYIHNFTCPCLHNFNSFLINSRDQNISFILPRTNLNLVLFCLSGWKSYCAGAWDKEVWNLQRESGGPTQLIWKSSSVLVYFFLFISSQRFLSIWSSNHELKIAVLKYLSNWHKVPSLASLCSSICPSVPWLRPQIGFQASSLHRWHKWYRWHIKVTLKCNVYCG